MLSYVQTLPGEKGSYVEMVKLAERWAARDKLRWLQ